MATGTHESLWIASAPAEPRAPLQEDLLVDVAVVGAGMCGLTTAYLLQERGLSVVVLEASRILEGVTGHTTAKLTSQHSLFYQKIAKHHGEERARLHGEASQQAIRFVQDTVSRLGIDARLRHGPAHTYTTKQEKVQEIEKEVQVCKDLGLPAQMVTQTELPFDVKAAIRFDDQAHFHPRRYLLALAKHFEERGGRIHEDTPVVALEDGEPATAKTTDATVRARDVVVTTNVPVQDRAYFVTRMKPKREYGISVRIEHPVLEGMYINAESPSRSVRPYESDDGPMLVVVGEAHPVGQSAPTSDPATTLETFAQAHFPVTSTEHWWSTQDFYPVDHLPLVGRHGPTSKHLHTATGFQGWGMTGTTVAGHLLADLVMDEENPLRDVYDPFRAGRIVKDLTSPGFVKLQAHVGRLFVQGRLEAHAADVHPGQGKVVKVDGQRLAVYRGDDGIIHARSAVCTHMDCIVAFNSVEKSWDCPCHGSRFAVDGSVLHGPAIVPLAEVGGEEGTKAERSEPRAPHKR